jgi:hypothetical protein
MSAVQLILHQAGKYLYKAVALVDLRDSGRKRADHAMKAKRLEVFFDFR